MTFIGIQYVAKLFKLYLNLNSSFVDCILKKYWPRKKPIKKEGGNVQFGTEGVFKATNIINALRIEKLQPYPVADTG